MTDLHDPAVRPRLYGSRFQNDPDGFYEEIRARYGPVAPVLLEGDIPAWLVCGYREVHQVTTDGQLFGSDSRRWNMWDQIPEDWPLRRNVAYNESVMFTEGQEHQQRSAAISDALAEVDQFELARECERIADLLIDTFAGAGEADLITQYAVGIPLRAAAHLFGLPESGTPEFIEVVLGILADVQEEAWDSYGRAYKIMHALVEDKIAHPGSDVPSHMLAHPAQLSTDTVVVDLLVTMGAVQTTTNWIGNAIRLMLTDDRFAATLGGGRASVGDALNEVLWKDTPSQCVIGRVATRDTRLGGRHIRAGDMLVLGLAAANADPNVRAADHAGGGNRAQMSFGHGDHGCPYPAPELAEIIARTSVEVLVDRLPDLTLAVPATDLVWRASVWMRGLVSLPVTFSPADVSGRGPTPGW